MKLRSSKIPFLREGEGLNSPVAVLPEPEKSGKYHTPVGPFGASKVVARLEADSELPTWTAIAGDGMATIDNSVGIYRATFRHLNSMHEDELVRNCKFNEQFVDSELGRERVRRDAQYQTASLVLDAAKSDLREAEDQAIAACGEAGVLFNVKDPAKSLDLMSEPLSKEASAAKLGLPFGTVSDTSPSSKYVDGFCKFSVGSFVGLSLFSITGTVHMAALHRDPLWALLFAMSLGMSVAHYGSRAVNMAFAHAAESVQRGEPLASRVIKIANACLLAATVIVIESVVEAKGLMARTEKLEAVKNLSGTSQSHSNSAGWFIALGAIVNVAYVAYSAYSGWTSVTTAVHNRIAEAQETERRDRRLAELKTSDCCEASACVSKVINLRVRVASLTEDRAAVLTESASRSAAIEATRKSLDENLPEAHRQILSQLWTEVRGAVNDWNVLVRAIACMKDGPLWRWWEPGKRRNLTGSGRGGA